MTEHAGQAIQLRYFAWVREKVGRGEEMLTVPDSVHTIRDLIGWLTTRGEEYKVAFANPDIIRVAIDQQHMSADAKLGHGKEVAFFPPVTGG